MTNLVPGADLQGIEKLVPMYTLSAVLKNNLSSGSLVIETPSTGIPATLSAFFQGPRGPGALSAGPGFVIVGNEVRYAISTLTRG